MQDIKETSPILDLCIDIYAAKAVNFGGCSMMDNLWELKFTALSNFPNDVCWIQKPNGFSSWPGYICS